MSQRTTSAVTRGQTLWAITLLTGMNLLNYIDRYVLPAIIERVRHDIPMSDTEQGIALTSFIWVYMLTAPIFGRLGDTHTRKYLIAFGVAVWSVATAAAAFVHSLPALIVARAVVGIGEAAYATIAPGIISDLYPREQRGKVMGIFFLATPVGSALGYILGGAIASQHSWNAAFLAVGLPGLVLAVGALFIAEPPRGQFDDDKHRAVPAGEAVRALARNAEYVWTVAGWTAYTFAIGGLSQWMPSYLQRVRHIDGAVATSWFGIITVLMGIAGTFAGTALSGRLHAKLRHHDLWVSGVSTLVAAPFAALAFYVPSTTGLWASLAIAEFFVFMGTGPINAVLVNCLPVAIRTTGMAFAILAIHALGDAISPTLIGAVSDATSLRTAVLLVPIAFGLGGFSWLHAQRTLPVRA